MPGGRSESKADGFGGYVLLAYAFAAFAMVCWSGNWVVGRAVRAEIPPLGLNFWRWSVATLVLLPFALSQARRDWHIAREHWKLVTALGATGAALFHSMIYVGLRTTEAVNALLLNSVGPIIVIIIAWALFRDTITRRQALGISISFLGTVILVSRGEVAALAALRLNSGDLWVLSALLVWGVYSNLLKRRPAQLGGLSLLLYMNVVGVALMLPAYLWELSNGERLTLSASTLASIAYTGVFASVIGFLCYNAAVARIGPVVTSFFLHLMPVFGGVMAIVFLGERLHPYHMMGFAVVLCGIYLSTSRTTPSRS